MKLAVILAPYDSGRANEGFGKGPDALIAGGLMETLALEGHDATVEEIGKISGLGDREIATGFAVCRSVSAMVADSIRNGRFPVVLAGNCLTACGAVGGESADSIIWFDQHADINTPETSTSGFLDGMALSTALGLCWRELARGIPGFHAVDPSRCMLVDARDLDPVEDHLIKRLPLIHTRTEDVAGKVVALQGSQRTHLHIDIDVHDPAKLQANRYVAPGGPNPATVRAAAACIARTVPVSGLTLTAYDPAFDAKGDVPPLVGRLLVEFLAAMERDLVAGQMP